MFEVCFGDMDAMQLPATISALVLLSYCHP